MKMSQEKILLGNNSYCKPSSVKSCLEGWHLNSDKSELNCTKVSSTGLLAILIFFHSLFNQWSANKKAQYLSLHFFTCISLFKFLSFLMELKVSRFQN